MEILRMKTGKQAGWKTEMRGEARNMDRDEIVFEQYYEDVYRFLRALTRDRDLAEELTQETFLRAIRSIDTYRGEGEFRVWLCSIAKNLFYSQMKKQKKSIPVADEDFPEGESQEKTLIGQDRGIGRRQWKFTRRCTGFGIPTRKFFL